MYRPLLLNLRSVTSPPPTPYLEFERRPLLSGDAWSMVKNDDEHMIQSCPLPWPSPFSAPADPVRLLCGAAAPVSCVVISDKKQRKGALRERRSRTFRPSWRLSSLQSKRCLWYRRHTMKTELCFVSWPSVAFYASTGVAKGFWASSRCGVLRAEMLSQNVFCFFAVCRRLGSRCCRCRCLRYFRT